MAKAAIYHEEAKRLFVNEGLSLDAIVGILEKKVSRKTLFNWKVEGEWEKKRREYIEQTQDLGAQLKEIVNAAVREAKARPTSKAIRAMFQALAAWDKYNGMRISKGEGMDEDEKLSGKELSPESLDYIKKVIYGLS